jgi:Tol biopolymer transport system component
MPLSPGTRLGGFEVVAAIGAGGMGEVYRARDLKLQRDVALKILPLSFASDPERLARFEREATTLASLNHPNIAQVYGIEDSGATRALVMELVDGEDLAQRVARRALRLEDALPIARQLAEALAAAHQAGIVHRDLKPANIRIRPDGEVKVLDFGLAKPTAATEGREGTHAGLEAATITSPAMTQAGVILGTAAYMAPEQAKGRAVDRRADIWAFGCVVFEMLAGKRAFSGDSVTDVLASVLSREPDWRALPADLPDSLRRLLRRCLQKDPRQRLHDISDARLELDDTLAVPAEAVTPLGRHRLAWALGVSGLALGVVAVALATLRPSADPVPSIVRPQRLTDMVGLEESPALSPDGRMLSFTAGVDGKRHVFVQFLDGGAPLPITKDLVDHQFPRWTPASSSLVYFSPPAPGASQGALYEIPALGGGAPRRLVDSMGAGDVRASDGALAYFRLSAATIQLVTSPLDGSSVKVVAQFEPTADYYLAPRWSPDGNWIAFQRGLTSTWDIFLAPAGGGEPRQLTRGAGEIRGLAWLPDGTGIVYSSGHGDPMIYLPSTRLWRVTLDGAVSQLTSGDVSYVDPDIANDGTVAVGRLRLASDIWKFPTDGPPAINVQNAVRVTTQTGHVVTPTAGPGDREIAFVSDRGGHANLWVIDVSSGILRQITHERDPRVTVGVPVWSPRGHAIAFVSSRGNPGNQNAIWLVNPDGSNLRNLVTHGMAPSWSPDGGVVYFSKPGFAGLAKIPADGGKPVDVRGERFRSPLSDGKTLYFVLERRLVDGLPGLEIHAANPEDGPSRLLTTVSRARVPSWQIFNPALSPDGQWMVQPLTDGFSTNIWALSTSTGEWRQITDFAGRPTFIARRVSWSSDGRSVLAAVAEGDADIVLLGGLLSTRRN